MGNESAKLAFLKWEVKPVWYVIYPSIAVSGDGKTVPIFGVDRSMPDIVRDYARIHSVEQFNQGYVPRPSDFRITLALKENGAAFEIMRRLAIGGVMFDVRCDILSDDNPIPLDNQSVYEPEELENFYGTWMTTIRNGKVVIGGMEKFIGCVITRESSTVDVGAIIVREFECMALKHAILDDIMLVEGDGTFPEANAKAMADKYVKKLV